jgi:2-C-methyl-D-erythritol 4-phosphate cytidylyltransferase/2-C-methyl-D-erythritol 2,4-cyclodiphosphate synthase
MAAMHKTIVLIVAAGRGHRAGGALPKQYRPLLGRPLIAWTMAAFAPLPVRVVIHPDDRVLYEAAATGLGALPPIHGGASRQDSVLNGLEALATDPPDHVLIHDAARPFCSAAMADRVLAALAGHDGAIAAVPVSDTLKRAEGGMAAAGPDRSALWRAQTPQGFRFAAILAAHRAARGLDLTDDAAVAERAGLKVALVAGGEDNFKVTHPEDFARAETLLLARHGDIRTGSGFDAHAFGDGDHVMLGGVRIAHDRGMVGHSDADVALHALTDALLGAIADGDIGRHFPPSDMKWKGADSATFLQFAAGRVQARGGIVAHADVTIICEAPKIAPHAAAMQTRIAGILGIDPGRVSVKATTTERMGFTGRREGIAVQATATVRLPA